MDAAQTSRQYNAIDIAKLVCAVFIVAIHVPPFGSADTTALAQTWNFIIRSYLGRIAVPFFFICAGFFLFRKTASRNDRPAPCRQYVLRILRLYGIWTVLYLPWVIRDAQESGKTLLTGTVSFLRNLLLTGSYNHLWYLPALAVAAALIGWLLQKGVSPKQILGISLLLYCLGLLGQSWFFLLKPLRGTALFSVFTLYETVFTTTRNGVFFGFPFVAMGMYLAYRPSGLSIRGSGMGFLLSMLLLYLEIRFTQGQGESLGSDMYLSLIPAAYCLLVLLLQIPFREVPVYRALRSLSLLLYLIHPAVNTGITIPLLRQLGLLDLAPLRFPLTLAISLLLCLGLQSLSARPKLRWLKKLYS